MFDFQCKKKRYLRGSGAFVSAISFLLLTAASAFSAPVQVGVIDGGDSSSSSNLAAQLNDDTFFDFNAVVISASDADSSGELSAYDVLILGDSGSNSNGYTAQMFAAIRTWMNSGGGVITVGWYGFATDYFTGQMATDADYITPIGTIAGGGYNFQSDGNLHIDNNSHPITTGITDFPINGCCLEYEDSIDTGAVKLGSPDGNPSGSAVAYQDTNGRSVYIGNLHLASTGYSQEPFTRTGVQDQLLEQAVFWASDASQESPVSIPTMTEWGMIIFSLLMGLTAIVFIRKRELAL